MKPTPLPQIQNAEVVEILNQTADLLEIEGANPFRVRAYRNAARTLFGLTEDIAEQVHEGKDLTQLPTIGDDLAAKIKEIVETGHLSFLEKLTSRQTDHCLGQLYLCRKLSL